jgi:predicted nucleic acid-binding protein
MIDCMIAAVAFRHRVGLLAADANLARVADVVGIDTG